MKKEVVPIGIRGIYPGSNGCTIFVGNEQKVFMIHVEHTIGKVIADFVREIQFAVA